MAHKIAFIIGRFQAPEMHEGYTHLIKSAIQIPEVFGFSIILGKSHLPPTERNAFTVGDRQKMIRRELREKFSINVSSCFMGFTEAIPDQREDSEWSASIDKIIANFLNSAPTHHEAILVCSRDSFKDHYSGKHEVVEIPELPNFSSTNLRKSIDFSQHEGNYEFMLGKLDVLSKQFPTAYATVDVAILDFGKDPIILDFDGENEPTRILLGRKPNEKRFRFPGGFVDPSDDSHEAAAQRELSEEVTGIQTTGGMNYITSQRIEDWRYRGEASKIITSFFWTEYYDGEPRAGDDLAEVKWFQLDEIEPEMIMPLHWSLMEKLKNFFL